MVWPGLSFQSRLLMKPSCFPAFFKEAKLWASSFLGPIATMGSSFFFLSAKCVVFSWDHLQVIWECFHFVSRSSIELREF